MKPARIGVRELRQNLSSALARVKAGERLVVTERNHPVAQLVPLDAEQSRLARLVAEGRVVPAADDSELVVEPVWLGPRDPGSRALEYERGDR